MFWELQPIEWPEEAVFLVKYKHYGLGTDWQRGNVYLKNKYVN
jgi:hypothetical protein